MGLKAFKYFFLFFLFASAIESTFADKHSCQGTSGKLGRFRDGDDPADWDYGPENASARGRGHLSPQEEAKILAIRLGGRGADALRRYGGITENMTTQQAKEILKDLRQIERMEGDAGENLRDAFPAFFQLLPHERLSTGAVINLGRTFEQIERNSNSSSKRIRIFPDSSVIIVKNRDGTMKPISQRVEALFSTFQNEWKEQAGLELTPTTGKEMGYPVAGTLERDLLPVHISDVFKFPLNESHLKDLSEIDMAFTSLGVGRSKNDSSTSTTSDSHFLTEVLFASQKRSPTDSSQNAIFIKDLNSFGPLARLASKERVFKSEKVKFDIENIPEDQVPKQEGFTIKGVKMTMTHPFVSTVEVYHTYPLTP
ncbi:MAG: hypothetical protein J0L93_06140 [Deltaproteobacteria bacterium]|nr:hypothetical protein [Deltaproteobacteria bacterium]